MNQNLLNRPVDIGTFKDIVQYYTKVAVCGRQYVLVDSLTRWLKGGSPTTHADKLLAAVYQSRKDPGDPIPSEKLKGCLLVFSILLVLGRGDLIHAFRRVQIDDRHLPISLQTLQTRISKMELCRKDEDELSAKFNETQWRFCPVKFDLDMDRECVPDEIMPICRKKNVNDKGGTSGVWIIEVYDEFVATELRSVVPHSKYQLSDEQNHWRYQFALKTFKEGWKSTYENEKKAFQGLRHHQGMVKYLGDYSHTGHREANLPESITTTHNILLEYGEMDLQEYFLAFSPPILNAEVKTFWKNMLEVAQALEGIHNLKTKKYETVQEYHGWHADIKPDNILIVQGKFKLADPGFATFIRAKKSDVDPKTILLGGTTTYAAPECHIKTRDSISAVPQTIDTWSLGCVLSVAASWVALDKQGIQQFRKIRKMQHKGPNESNMQMRNSPRPNDQESIPGDYFHDGREVLSVVIDWHKYLRLSLRAADTITHRVLDLIEHGMLVGNPEQRMKSKSVCAELARILDGDEPSGAVIPPPYIVKALCEMDEDASSCISTPVSTLYNPPHGEPLSISKKRQAANSTLLGLPIIKTAHRSEHRKVLAGFQPQTADCTQLNTQTTSTLTHGIKFPSLQAIYTHNNSHESQIQATRPMLQQEFRNERKVPEAPRRPTYRNVFQARDELEKQRTDGGATRGWSHLNPLKDRRREDPLLSSYFLDRNRDIKFLVDNASTMSEYWYEATYLLTTLMMKTEGLDKDGMDLSFTLGPISVKGKKSTSKFEKAMRDARPTQGDKIPTSTNMRTSLSKILNEYVNMVENKLGSNTGVKDLTIIVLTDGIWGGENERDSVNDMIIQLLKRLKTTIDHLRDRPVSIQFIQFGNDEDATFRLRKLDNGLKWEGIPDIIDTEPSNGDVNKMILGSFVESYDKEADDEENYEESYTSHHQAHRFSDPAPQSIHEIPYLNRAATHPPVVTPDQSSLMPQAYPSNVEDGRTGRIT